MAEKQIWKLISKESAKDFDVITVGLIIPNVGTLVRVLTMSNNIPQQMTCTFIPNVTIHNTRLTRFADIPTKKKS